MSDLAGSLYRPGDALASWLDLTDFGGDPSGVGDNTAALAAAIAQAEAIAASTAYGYAAPVIYLRAGVWRFATPVTEWVTKPLKIVGDGPDRTWIKLDGDYGAGSFWLTVHDCWRNAEMQPTDLTALDLSAMNAGFEAGGFTILGDRTNECSGILFQNRNDFALMRDVSAYYLNGTAYGLASENYDRDCVRESLFSNLRAYFCGNTANSEAAIEVGNGDNAGDGTNHVTFQQLWTQYNLGTSLRMWNDFAADEVMRRMRIFDWMLHGLGTSASAPAVDLAVIEGRVVDLEVFGLKTNSSSEVAGTPYACLRLRTFNTYYPLRVGIRGLDISNCEGDGIVVERCSALHLEGHSEPAGITGDELRITAGAVDQAMILIQARQAATRKFDIADNQLDNVYGIVARTSEGLDVHRWRNQNQAFDLVTTVPLVLALIATAQAVTTANVTFYYRVQTGGRIDGLYVDVGNQSGNIAAAVYRNSGAGRSAVPGARAATTGSIACPAVGTQLLSFGADVDVYPGDWIAFAADNTTATFRCLSSTNQATDIAAGFSCQETAYPPPATAAPTSNSVRRPPVLVGNPA